MRENRFEKMKKVLIRSAEILAVALIIAATAFFISRVVKLKQLTDTDGKTTESLTEKAETNVPESGTQYDGFYVNDDGDFIFVDPDPCEENSELESGKIEAPAERDVAPEDDPNYDATVAVPQTQNDTGSQTAEQGR